MWKCARCGERNDDAAPACANCAGTPDGRAAEEPGVPPAGRLAKVWSCTSEPEAELLRVALRRAGIPSVLENVGGASFAVGLGTAAVPFVITVAEPDAARALDVLKAEIERVPDEAYVPPVAMLRFACACGKTLEVPPDFQGLEMDCPFCGKPLRAG